MAAKVRDAYVGETRNQLREGFGDYNYENSFFRYEGEWKDGRKHGLGKLILADGGYYEGDFKWGEIEGSGTQVFGLMGNKYSGQFHMGEMHGQGIMHYKNGSVYEGEWHRNLKQGYGIFKHLDNSIYQGNLYNDQRYGEGTQVYRHLIVSTDKKGSAKGTKSEPPKVAPTADSEIQEKVVPNEESPADQVSFVSRFCRPGEYIIMVTDVTKPPFMDTMLQPGFIKVKVNLPQKVKRSAGSVKNKDHGPRWDTSKHI